MNVIPKASAAQLSEPNYKVETVDSYVADLESAIERLKEKIDSLELANTTMRRRIEVLEGVG